MRYRNESAVPMLLVPWNHVNEFTGSNSDHLIGPRKPEDPGPLDIAAVSGKIHGYPVLQVPIEDVIPPGGTWQFPHMFVKVVYMLAKIKTKPTRTEALVPVGDDPLAAFAEARSGFRGAEGKDRHTLVDRDDKNQRSRLRYFAVTTS